MANYDPNRPRPSVDGTAALPGDLPATHDTETPAAATAAPTGAGAPVADTDADPAPAPASHLLPRQAAPVDRRVLAAFGGAVAVGWLLAAVAAWWLWRRWRRR